MALAVNSTFTSVSSSRCNGKDGRSSGETRPFSYLTRSVNPRVPAVIREQPCVDSDIYFSSPNVARLGEDIPPPRPPRSPKLSRMAIPDKPPRTPPRSPLAGRAHLSCTQSDSDLHSHVHLRVPQPGTPPPRTPPHGLGSKQMFFPSDDRNPPRSPRMLPRSFHPPDDIPAVPPRSPRLPPKTFKMSQLPPPQNQPQPLVGRSISNRSDRSDRAHSYNPQSDSRTDCKKMTRQTSADTVRITVQPEREMLRSAPPPPKQTPVITEQPKSAKNRRNNDKPTREQPGSKSDKNKKNQKSEKNQKNKKSGNRETFEIEKPEEKKGCCNNCAKICVNDCSEFIIELCLD